MKNILALFAGLALSLAFVACDKDSKTPVDEVSDTSTQDTADVRDTGSEEDTSVPPDTGSDDTGSDAVEE